MTIRSRTDGDRLSCVVADDHPALVEAVSVVLAADGLDVVARAPDGADALAAIQRLKPSVAVLDLVMPKLSGIEVARCAARTSPTTACVLYTGHVERELLVEALDAGVRGYVLKEAPLAELARAVRLAAAGEIYVDPVIAPTLIRGGSNSLYPLLSGRERDILRLLADGKSNDGIAEALFISPDTVRTYIRRAMQKLEADTRTQAVAIAVRESFIS
jgi:DNA-binding NarL/FixJ family response regulator